MVKQSVGYIAPHHFGDPTQLRPPVAAYTGTQAGESCDEIAFDSGIIVEALLVNDKIFGSFQSIRWENTTRELALFQPAKTTRLHKETRNLRRYKSKERHAGNPE
jgi:hypothetical protein